MDVSSIAFFNTADFEEWRIEQTTGINTTECHYKIKIRVRIRSDYIT